MNKDRRTGRSTALALHLLSVAMRKQGDWVPIVDHHCEYKANQHLAKIMFDAIHKLGLSGFTFSSSGSPPLVMFRGIPNRTYNGVDKAIDILTEDNPSCYNKDNGKSS